MPPSPNSSASVTLAEDYFAAGDARFLQAVREVKDGAALTSLAQRWQADPRPWARQQALAYLDMPFSVPGHGPLVKRLFKHAEAVGDDEIAGVCLAAFDRLVRRVRSWTFSYDSDARTSSRIEILKVPRNTLPQEIILKRQGQNVRYIAPYKATARLFKWRTRYYLQRRVWRYFRKLAHTQSQRYLPAVRAALLRFREEDFAVGENLLDSWGFMHLCFGSCPAVKFTNLRATLTEGSTLASLVAAPRYAHLWENAAGRDLSLELVGQAAARPIRTWAVQMHRKLRVKIPAEPNIDVLVALLNHADEEIQAYGAELIQTSTDAAKWPVDFWLRLLQTENPACAQMICDALQKHVHSDRLSLAQCVSIGNAKPVAISRLGLSFLKERPVNRAEDRAELARLADSQCLATGRDTALFALGHLGKAEVYQADLAGRFFDSLQVTMREGAWDWLSSPDSPGWKDPVLWSRISETPFDDLRLKMVDALTEREVQPRVHGDSLEHIWISVLLGVHRGGRQKLKAVKQIRDSIGKDPGIAEQLLPVLASAVRSIRGPEARAALSALLTLTAQKPELEPLIAKTLPELNLEAVAA